MTCPLTFICLLAGSFTVTDGDTIHPLMLGYDTKLVDFR